MVKTIKISDEAYQKLEELREKRETFDEAVKRLLKVFEALHDVSDTLGPSHFLKERPIVDARAKETVDRRGDSPKVPDVPIQ